MAPFYGDLVVFGLVATLAVVVAVSGTVTLLQRWGWIDATIAPDAPGSRADAVAPSESPSVI